MLELLNTALVSIIPRSVSELQMFIYVGIVLIALAVIFGPILSD